ncbi:MAG: hypothetical protein H7A25_25900 [Leptospiraceae bacterium]|nr:hypothetical protein [Leptospiraceae bacterium]
MQIKLLMSFFIYLLSYTYILSDEKKCNYSNPAYNMCFKIEQCFIKMKINKHAHYHDAFYKWGMGGSNGLNYNSQKEPYYWIINQVPESHRFLLQAGDWIYWIDECNPYIQNRLEDDMTRKQYAEHVPLIDTLALFLFTAFQNIDTIVVGRLVNGERVRMTLNMKELFRKDLKEKEIQNRHILRKIFFFWEWGDYF